MRWLALLMFSGPAMADSLIATQTIRAQTILTAEDFAVVDADIPGALSDPAAVIGLDHCRGLNVATRATKKEPRRPPALRDLAARVRARRASSAAEATPQRAPT